MRYEDIIDLLSDVKENILLIEDKYKVAVDNDDVKSVLKPKVKASLEGLRSCLEYCAHDIYEKYYGGGKKIYFPYAKEESNFKMNVEKYFKKLDILIPEIYNLLESIQPFKCGSDWLINLCELTNYNKHKGLSEQQRVDKGRININDGMIVIEDSASVFLSNININGVDQGSDIVIDSDGNLIYDKETVNFTIDEIKWVEFKFSNSNIGVKELLIEAFYNIELFIKKLYEVIN